MVPREIATYAAFSIMLVGTANPQTTITVTVGPSGQFSTIGAAAASEIPGNSYVINIDPTGVYLNDFAEFGADTVINGNGAKITANMPPPNEKGLFWTANSLTINNLSLIAEAGFGISQSLGGNAALIRDQSSTATTLALNNVLIEGGQDGVLTGGGNFVETVTITNSSIVNNGAPNGQTHGFYVNDAGTVTVSGSLFCGTNTGHHLKVRAASTTISGSIFYIGTATGAPSECNIGSASLAIDLPNGGTVEVTNSQIYQGPANQNGSMLRYGEEGLVAGFSNTLDVNNTLFDNLKPGVGNHSIAIDELSKCIVPVTGTDTFIGTQPIQPPGCVSGTSPAPRPAPQPSAPLPPPTPGAHHNHYHGG